VLNLDARRRTALESAYPLTPASQLAAAASNIMEARDPGPCIGLQIEGTKHTLAASGAAPIVIIQADKAGLTDRYQTDTF